MIHKLNSAFPTIEISYSDSIPRGIDILINATAVGMKENDQTLLSLSNLDGKTLVAEIVISPEIICTLKKATKKACKIHKGIAMLKGQIKLMHEFME